MIGDTYYIRTGVTIGAGSVVTKDVPNSTTVVGVPERVIKTPNNFNKQPYYAFLARQFAISKYKSILTNYFRLVDKYS